MTVPHSNIHETDVAIIGAGPVGLFAVFELGMLNIRAHVIDTLPAVGGQCTALYPEKPIYDIPGFPSVAGAELIAHLERQAAPFNPTYHLGQQVMGCSKTETGWQLTTNTGTVIHAKAVLIAAGCGAFGPNRPPLPGIEQFEGTSVHYLVARREDFRGKTLVIAGGGDSAVDWAVSLAELAQKIYVVHRRDKFRAAPDMVGKMQALAASGKIEMVVPYQLDGLKAKDSPLRPPASGGSDVAHASAGSISIASPPAAQSETSPLAAHSEAPPLAGGVGGKPAPALAAVTVKHMDGQTRDLSADHLLAFFGLSMELGPIAQWGLGLEGSHIAVTPGTQATNVPGIFAIGDIATYPHKLKLILCGFAEAAQAAHAIREIVHPGVAYHFEYSTTSGVRA